MQRVFIGLASAIICGLYFGYSRGNVEAAILGTIGGWVCSMGTIGVWDTFFRRG